MRYMDMTPDQLREEYWAERRGLYNTSELARHVTSGGARRMLAGQTGDKLARFDLIVNVANKRGINLLETATEEETMSEIKQGQIYAGRLSDGSPAVVRVQNETPELVHAVLLNSDLLGREATIKTAGLADRFRLVSDGPQFTSKQVAGWLEEVAGND